MDSIAFRVDGFAVPKGSFTPVRNGGFRPQGNPERINAWRTDCRGAAKAAMDGHAPFTGPIRLTADITLPYPKSSVRKYQMGWLAHTKRPDADKLLRSICDHLTGIVWADDAQVCHFTMSKNYAWDDMPGADIQVREMDDEWLKSYAHNRRMLIDAIRRTEAS